MRSSPGRLAAWSIVCGAICAASTAPLRAQAPPSDPPLPTAIEEALIEHACGGLHPAGTVETNAYLDCRANQLASLRAEFGRDLRRLSSGERRTIDSSCTQLRASRGQDAYVACLAGQLAALRGRGGRNAPSPAESAAPAAAAPDTPIAAVAPAVEPSSRSSSMWIVAALVALIAGVAGALLIRVRSRRSFGVCHTCGAKLLERGDLCHACRHEAAEALRRATAERADQARAAADEAQRKQAAREEEEQQRVRDEEMRRRQLEAAEQARVREQEEQVQRRREEDERQRQQQRQTDAAASPSEFDPYAALGVQRTAGATEIEAAYQEARAKYDLELVAGLSTELQDHFKRKGEAAQRAYEMLTGR